MDEVRSNNSGKIFLPSGIVIDIREFVKTNKVAVYQSLSKEISSNVSTMTSGDTISVAKAKGASFIEVYVEQGEVRVCSNGETASAIKGIPIGIGYMQSFGFGPLSIYCTRDAKLTVVQR